MKSYPPVLLPTSICPDVGAVEVPVPPFEIPRIPVTSEVRSISVATTCPATALKTPDSEPKKSVEVPEVPPSTLNCVVDAKGRVEAIVVEVAVNVAWIASVDVAIPQFASVGAQEGFNVSPG